MKTTIIFSLILLLASCATQKRCSVKFPPETNTKDSVVYIDRIEYRDTLITLALPADSAQTSAQLADIALTPLIAETDNATASATLDNDRLVLQVNEKAQTIEAEIQTKIEYIERIKWHTRTEVKRIKYIPQHYKTLYKISIAWLLLWIIGGGIYLYAKFKEKTLFSSIQESYGNKGREA